jgi:small-conductance mechanosensitive channel
VVPKAKGGALSAGGEASAFAAVRDEAGAASRRLEEVTEALSQASRRLKEVCVFFACLGRGLTCVLQVADFANRTASGALMTAVSAEVERLRTQHADAVREKSATDSKCRKLTDKVAVLEKEKADLRRQLAGERREINEALAREKAAQAEAKLARAEGNIARERAEQLQERLTALKGRMERAEAVSRAEAERTRKQLMDTYRELGAGTGEFEVPDREAGLRFLEWVQEELQALLTVVEGFMSYASLVTCEGAMNALSREGCRHLLGRRQRRHPSLEAFAAAAGPTETKRAGTPFAGFGTLTKACGDVHLRRVLVQSPGPRAIWPIVTGPAWPPLYYGPNL